MFAELMLKDLRLHRTLIILAIACALVFEGLLPGFTSYFERRQMIQAGVKYDWRQAAFAVYQLAMFSAAGSCLFAAIVGAATRTAERRERWSEFAAMLPISRLQRALASLLIAAALAGAVWSFHATILWLTVNAGPSFLARYEAEGYADWTRNYLIGTAKLSVGMFGLTWLGASFMRNAFVLVAVIAGVLTAGVIAVQELYNVYYRDPTLHAAEWMPRYLAAVAIIGVIGIIAGTVVSARRVEP